VTVPLDDLGRHRGGLEAEPDAYIFLDEGIDEGKRPYGPGDLAHANRRARPLEALPVSLHLPVPVGELESEGNRFGVDTMGTADHDGILVVMGAPFEDLEQFIQIGQEDVGGLLEQAGQGGIKYVR